MNNEKMDAQTYDTAYAFSSFGEGKILSEQTTQPNNTAPTDAAVSLRALAPTIIYRNGIIWNEGAQCEIVDAPIDALQLSTRSYNAIHRFFIKAIMYDQKTIMVSDLVKLTYDDLLGFRNLGSKSMEEIVEKLSVYLYGSVAGSDDEFGKFSSLDNTNTIYTIAPEYELLNGTITHKNSGQIVMDVYIERLGLGSRAIKSLRHERINKLSELLVLYPQQIKGFSKMGQTSVSEIINTVPTYLSAHQEKPTAVYESIEQDINSSSNKVIILPSFDTGEPVVAPDYTIYEKKIYNRDTLKVIPDAPIEVLSLGVRAINCLLQNESKTISSLIGMRYEDFRAIRNLGLQTAQEIINKLYLYLKEKNEQSQQQTANRIVISLDKIIQVFEARDFSFLSVEDICSALPDSNTDDVKIGIDQLVSEKRIVIENNLYGLNYPSFLETFESMFSDGHIDERGLRIFNARAEGKTLEEIGTSEEITRERVRQIEKKNFEKVTNRNYNTFSEDRYAYIFKQYALDREFFFNFLSEGNGVWYYLNTRYSKGNADPVDALEDKQIPVELRRKIEEWIYQGYLQIDGRYITLQRGNIEDIVLEKYCREEKTLEEYFTCYEDFLLQHGLEQNDKLIVSDSVKGSRYNRLSESKKLLWKQNQRLRYYDVDAGDYTELFETLKLGQYQNIEYSARKFYIEYPELMQQYVIQDEYELHNLLKKIGAEKENQSLNFGRMPVLQFGNFNRDTAVKEILFAVAPVTVDDLAEMISLEYGHRIETIKANWLNCIDEYYHQGAYSVDYVAMPEDHMEQLKNQLLDDFYFLSEVRAIYRKLVLNADLTLVSSFNMKRLGFHVNGTYVFKNFLSVDAYFKYLLTNNDITDARNINDRYSFLGAYASCMNALKDTYEIIEFEPLQYINIRRLEKIGITRDLLGRFCDQVWSFVAEDEYFTFYHLRIQGMETDLDCLGLEDWFYSSLLREDKRFSYQRFGENVVFRPGNKEFSMQDFLADLIQKESKVDIDEFIDNLRNDYGITADKTNVLEKIKGSEIYYDRIMEKLYADYSVYYEEI